MTTLADWSLSYQGKVRDLYIPDSASSAASADRLLIVASDRVSAFDVVLAPDIPGKGAALTRISAWWMDVFSDIPQHLLDESPPEEVADRAVIAQSLSMLPVECVVRGYLVGSGWKDYREHGTVCGIALPEGLSEGDRLPEPLFTPATKAALGDHDENISYDEVVDLVGADNARALRDTSLTIYTRAHQVAWERGLVLADTKFEFGRGEKPGEIILADELLTPDSSRYWDVERYQAGGDDRLESFDKQVIRRWLASTWDKTGTPPSLPADIVSTTQERYLELEQRLRG
ncbi:phosphoribosylaminoimidazolesuccinocarboxamide synthase [Pontimonas sp.]|uniref:phosphoribosylaminoimidazolesuccinocarboxamide synthase n=1 Tax=Pontimonas sp. TaxID=2304492 RepID=UPI00287028FF|nr:phosphoribosylaminoimidazolesuccinocarboxamide synthase [Pontimonas sp.]MDR9434797.1 phosphoribosylaminoimidazolesuccinocarboxamide synthase [Pontimonas sp.]